MLSDAVSDNPVVVVVLRAMILQYHVLDGSRNRQRCEYQ